MKDLIHFAHGNGFPSPCYKQMFNGLEDDFDYCFIDRIGHNPNYPVKDNWDSLVNEVIESIIAQADQPVIAVGHSLGGVLSVLAAIQRPELFKAVIMLDSPLLGSFKSTLVKIAKTFGVIDKVTPAQQSRGRRNFWKNHEELVTYLRSRDLFKNFTEACLNDFIIYGLEHKSDGYYLRFDSETEYQIYRTVPHNIPDFAGKLVVPTCLIYGDKSNVVDTMDVRYMKNRFNIKSDKISGSHLFPMEYPQAAAKQIIQAINAIINK